MSLWDNLVDIDVPRCTIREAKENSRHRGEERPVVSIHSLEEFSFQPSGVFNVFDPSSLQSHYECFEMLAVRSFCFAMSSKSPHQGTCWVHEMPLFDVEILDARNVVRPDEKQYCDPGDSADSAYLGGPIEIRWHMLVCVVWQDSFTCMLEEERQTCKANVGALHHEEVVQVQCCR